MKVLATLVLLGSGFLQTDVPKNPDKILQIEQKFSLHFLSTWNDRWIFQGYDPSFRFHWIPVVMPVNASEHDAFIALGGAVNCAVYYEKMIKEKLVVPTSAATQQKDCRPTFAGCND